MNNRLPRSLIVIAALTGGITILMLGIVLFSFFSPDVENPNIKTAPTSAIITISPSERKFPQNPNNEYTESVREIEQSNSDFFIHEKKVGALLLKLPYRGQHLAMTYSYAKNSYIATIPTSNKELGEKELDDFLKNNDVERSWIRRLEINYN